MLIGLVRDSVMQCFCHTCRAPVLPAVVSRRAAAPFKKAKGAGGNKPRTKQPKKVKFITTEIRCQEMSKGGLAYEVILAEPVGAPVVPKRPLSPGTKTCSAEEIEEKLRAAEERRMSLEASKMAAIAAKMAKIEEASRKKDEQTTLFISSTKEALDAKMETHVEKREAYISDLRSKVKDHLEGVEKTRLSLEQQTGEIWKAIEGKLSTAAAQRDDNLKKMLDRLKEHEEQVQKVRTHNSEKFHQLEASIQEKLDLASHRRAQIELGQKEKLRNYNMKLAEAKASVDLQETTKSEEVSKELESKLTIAEHNREKEIQKKLENLKKQNVRIAEARASVEVQESSKSVVIKELETKLTIAEQNREKEIQKKLDNLKKQERRAEMVRQNKAALAEQNNEAGVTASSG